MTDCDITVRLTALTTGYRRKKGDVVIGRDIDATLSRGELTCLLGPNGAGKSTLLKTLCGFIAPLGGGIEVCGRSLGDYTASQLATVIGVVLTERLMLSNMSVEELVGLGRSPYTGFWGKLSDADHAVVDEAIELMHIGHLRHRMNQTLSDGERQKMMIAKAIAQQTPVIFLDEPTAFLDYPSKVEIMLLLQRLAREKGLTVFLSTHDLELALQISDRIWLLDKSLGLRTGTPEDLSLDGSMADYFERSGVAFDSGNGLFKIDCPIERSMCVLGDGVRAAMVKKALRRCGIGSAEPTSAGVCGTVEVTEQGYVYGGKIYSTIGELLCAVGDGVVVGH